MKEQLIRQVLESLSAILVILVSYASTVVAGYFSKKKAETEAKIGKANYDFFYACAENTFHEVEQLAKLNGWNANDKLEEFNEKLRTYLPELADEEINHLREAIVGKNNANVNKVIDSVKPTVVNVSVPKDVDSSNVKATAENVFNAMKNAMSNTSVATPNVLATPVQPVENTVNNEQPTTDAKVVGIDVANQSDFIASATVNTNTGNVVSAENATTENNTPVQ